MSLLSLYGQHFLRYGPIFKIAIFGNETWPQEKVQEIAHTVSFYPMGLKWSLIFKNSIFGHESCQVAKVSEVAHILSFYLTGVEIELIFTLWTTVSEIRANFPKFSKLPYLRMKLGN